MERFFLFLLELIKPQIYRNGSIRAARSKTPDGLEALEMASGFRVRCGCRGETTSWTNFLGQETLPIRQGQLQHCLEPEGLGAWEVGRHTAQGMLCKTLSCCRCSAVLGPPPLHSGCTVPPRKRFSFLFIYFFVFSLFRAVRTAYGSSQARSRIGVATAGLHHSYSNSGSRLHL